MRDLAAVVELLGWRGTLLPPRRLLGEQVAIVASHEPGPARSERPRVAGVIAARASWEGARRAAGNYAAFCERVAVVPEKVLRDPLVPRDAELRGIGLVVSFGESELELVISPEPYEAPPWTPVIDVFLEQVENALLTDVRARTVG